MFRFTFLRINSIIPIIVNLYPKTLALNGSLRSSFGFTLIERMLPNLGFDPEFKKLLESKPLKFLFDTSDVMMYFEGKVQKKRQNYILSTQKFDFWREKLNKKNLIFPINPNLAISPLFREESNYTGYYFFEASNFIDDLIHQFTIYYNLRIPSKAKKILNTLFCFGKLFKLAEGRMFKQLLLQRVRKKLEISTNKHIASFFLKKFILKNQNTSFPKFNAFKPKKFLEIYHWFLEKAGYLHYGKINTGVFLIWRSMIKYLESLQQEEQFRNKKGKLLENWCYEQAATRGFSAKKLILRNKGRKPTQNYSEMKKQIEDFSGPILKFEFEFPQKKQKYSFAEYDLLFKIKAHLFIFEMKATAAPIKEHGDYFNWIGMFNYNLAKLNSITELLKDAIKTNLVNDGFFQGIKHYHSFIIQTEGLISNVYVMIPQGYVKFLDIIKDYIEKNALDEFLFNLL